MFICSLKRILVCGTKGKKSNNFYLLLRFILCRFLLSFIISLLGKLLRKKSNWNREFQRPFECGFSSKEEFRIPFSIHFFLIILIFILFDVELIIFFPYTIRLGFYQSLLFFSYYVSFLFLVTLGLFIEWDRAALEWSK